jgi:segregation and condensation protein B
MKLSDIESAVEAALFAAGEAVNAKDLADAAGLDVKTLLSVAERLRDALEKANRGIELVKVGEGYQLRTRAAHYGAVTALFTAPGRKPLTNALLETLAIIAYRQPVTKAQIEEIRGVDAAHAVSRLSELGLITERGRAEQPGRPLLFGTSDEFLRHYGIVNAQRLPPLAEGGEAEAVLEDGIEAFYGGEPPDSEGAAGGFERGDAYDGADA